MTSTATHTALVHPRRAELVGGITDARQFFSQHQDVEPVPGSDSDADGLINFILAEQTVSPELQKLLDEQRRNLINLTGVGTAYAKRKAEVQKDPELKYDPVLWETIFTNLPLMGPSKFSKQTFLKEIRGVEIAVEFINLIMNAIVTEGATALTDFREFLERQGKAIRLGTEKSRESFKLGCICIVLETVRVAGETVFVPKLKAYFINFTRETSKWTAACAKGETITINFEYKQAVSVFNYEALEDPAIREKFTAFVKSSQKEDITASENFFGAAFDAETP